MRDIPKMRYPEVYERLLADVEAAHEACLAAPLLEIGEARRAKERALAQLSRFNCGESEEAPS